MSAKTSNQTLRMPHKLKLEALVKAKKQNRKFNNYVVNLIEQDLLK